MTVSSLKGALERVRDTMIAHKDELIRLDSQNGDGDLGLSMAARFSAVAGCVDEAQQDIGRALQKCSAALNESCPSTLGTILSFGFLGMAKALRGQTQADAGQVAAAMRAGAELIMQKAGSKTGEKTILDALVPGIEALERQAPEGFAPAFSAAAAAARQGSESTRAMRSVHGRAAYYGDKSVGVLDGGSVAGALIFEAISDYLTQA